MAKKFFLSYGREPKTNDFVTKLKQDLEHKGFSMWRDTEGIRAGSSLSAEIARSIDACKGLIFVITNKSINSDWCVKELIRAQEKQKSIFLIRFEEVDYEQSDNARTAKFYMGDAKYLDFRPELNNYGGCLDELIRGMIQSIQQQAAEEVDSPPPGETQQPRGATGGSTQGKKNSKRDTEPEESDLLTSVAMKVSKYDALGYKLNFEKVDIENIENETTRNYSRVMKILTEWKERQTRKPITWDTLIKAVREMGMDHLADELEKKFGP